MTKSGASIRLPVLAQAVAQVLLALVALAVPAASREPDQIIVSGVLKYDDGAPAAGVGIVLKAWEFDWRYNADEGRYIDRVSGARADLVFIQDQKPDALTDANGRFQIRIDRKRLKHRQFTLFRQVESISISKKAMFGYSRLESKSGQFVFELDKKSFEADLTDILAPISKDVSATGFLAYDEKGRQETAMYVPTALSNLLHLVPPSASTGAPAALNETKPTASGAGNIVEKAPPAKPEASQEQARAGQPAASGAAQFADFLNRATEKDVKELAHRLNSGKGAEVGVAGAPAGQPAASGAAKMAEQALPVKAEPSQEQGDLGRLEQGCRAGDASACTELTRGCQAGKASYCERLHSMMPPQMKELFNRMTEEGGKSYAHLLNKMTEEGARKFGKWQAKMTSDDTEQFAAFLNRATESDVDQAVERLNTAAAAGKDLKGTWWSPPSPTLVLSTQPGNIQVYLDDKFKGITSEDEGKLVIEGLAPGPHSLRLSLPGYKQWKQEVTLPAGGTLPVTAKLEPAGPKPLAFEEVEEALKNGISVKRVMALVRQFGVDFVLTPEQTERLRKAGADGDLLFLITQSKK